MLDVHVLALYMLNLGTVHGVNNVNNWQSYGNNDSHVYLEALIMLALLYFLNSHNLQNCNTVIVELYFLKIWVFVLLTSLFQHYSVQLSVWQTFVSKLSWF